MFLTVCLTLLLSVRNCWLGRESMACIILQTATKSICYIRYITVTSYSYVQCPLSCLSGLLTGSIHNLIQSTYTVHNGNKRNAKKYFSSGDCQHRVHSHGVSATVSKTDLTIEVFVAVEVADISVLVNRSICFYRTHRLHQEKNDCRTRYRTV